MIFIWTSKSIPWSNKFRKYIILFAYLKTHVYYKIIYYILKAYMLYAYLKKSQKVRRNPLVKKCVKLYFIQLLPCLFNDNCFGVIINQQKTHNKQKPKPWLGHIGKRSFKMKVREVEVGWGEYTRLAGKCAR